MQFFYILLFDQSYMHIYIDILNHLLKLIYNTDDIYKCKKYSMFIIYS